MIKRWLWILLVLNIELSAVHIVFAQTADKVKTIDSLEMNQTIQSSLLYKYNPEILIHPSYKDSTLLYSGYLRNSIITLPSSLSWQSHLQIDLLTPWKQELAKQDRMRTLNTILQAVGAGGTAYIMYEHIKKYGLK
jgi:hypothetical protein